MKGILKRPSLSTTTPPVPTLNPQSNDNPQSKGGIKWDEENILITEAEKCSTMKIDEPKTPFMRYDSVTDTISNLDGHSVPAFELEAALVSAASGAKHGRSASQSSNFSTNSSLMSPSTSGDLSKEFEHRVHVSDHEWTSEEEKPENEAKRQKFNQLRTEHYNMRNVLLHARELLSNEELDESYSDPNAHTMDPDRADESEEEYDSDDEMDTEKNTR